MPSTVCKTCGLPDELCVCEAVSKDEAELEIDTSERRYGKEVTLVSNLPEDIDKDELSSTLKSQLACGGTINDDGTIELQGDHTGRINGILEDEGFAVA